MNSRVILVIVIVVLILLGVFVASDVRRFLATTRGTPSTLGASTSLAPTQTQIKQITVSASNFKFSPQVISVNRGDQVQLTLDNKEGAHDWRVDQFNASTQVINAGQSDTVTFTTDKAGQFEFYCSVDGHRSMGMTGALIVL